MLYQYNTTQYIDEKESHICCIVANIAETIFHLAIVWLCTIKFITKKSIKSLPRRVFHIHLYINDISHIFRYIFCKVSLVYLDSIDMCYEFSKSLQLADTVYLFHFWNQLKHTHSQKASISKLYNMCLRHNEANSYTVIVDVFGLLYI